MKAVLLVGGEGTRLRPLTYSTPKPLLPIGGRSLVERQLDWLAGHGVTEVTLAVGYRSDAFVERARSLAADFAGTRVRVVIEDEPLGTAGAIRHAADASGIRERFVVCNGDVLTGLDVSALVEFHREREAEATIHLVRVGDPSAFGVVATAPDGRVLAFVEKPAPGTASSDCVNAGTYVLEPSVLERIPAGISSSIERETFPALVADAAALYARPTDDSWMDVGTPDTYRAAHLELFAGRLPGGLGGQVELAPGVWAAPSVRDDVARALAQGRVEAPCSIGAGTVLAEDVRVVRASVGDGCRLAKGAVVVDSVLLDEVEVGAGARVERSIVGPGYRVAEHEQLVDAVVDRSATPAGS